MSKTAKIIKCEFTSTWNHPTSGAVYNYHQVSFDNGDVGNHGCAEKYPPTLTVGNIVEYDIDEESKKIKIFKIVTHYSKMAPTNSPKSRSRAKPKDEFLGYVFGYAKDLIIAGKTLKDVDEMDKMATHMYISLGEMLSTDKESTETPSES